VLNPLGLQIQTPDVKAQAPGFGAPAGVAVEGLDCRDAHAVNDTINSASIGARLIGAKDLNSTAIA
jgi:hypothetical protein